MKDSARSVMRFLEWEYPRFVTVPELIQALGQSDIRKRVSELIAAGYRIEKERRGRALPPGRRTWRSPRG